MVRKESTKRNVSRSQKVGLQFPIGRIHTRLRRGGYTKRVGADASVFLAAALEYITTEILELAHDNALGKGKRRISPSDILATIRGDSELNQLLDGAAIPDGGTVPGIRAVLLPP